MTKSSPVVSELLIFIAYGQWYLSNGVDIEPDSPDASELLDAAIDAGGFAQVGNSMAVLTPELHTGDVPLVVEVWDRERRADDPDGYRGELVVGRHGVIVSSYDGSEWRVEAPAGSYNLTLIRGQAAHDPPIPWRLQLFPSAAGRRNGPGSRRSSVPIETKRQQLMEVTLPVQRGSFFWDLMELRLDRDFNELLREVAPTVTTPVCINLYRSALTEIPEWVRLVPNLRQLLVHYNKITALPRWFSELTRLQRVVLAFNRDFAPLPDLLADLPALAQLDLEGTAIARLPRSMSTMSRLQHLHIQRTRLTELPDWIGQLTQLQTLDLSNTRITRLPESIGQLSTLEYLALSDTAVTEVPDTLADLQKLKSLSLSGTAITALPPALLERDPPLDLRIHGTPLQQRLRKRR